MAAEAESGGAAPSGQERTLSADDYQRLLDRLRHALQYAEAARATVEEALRVLGAAREGEDGETTDARRSEPPT